MELVEGKELNLSLERGEGSQAIFRNAWFNSLLVLSSWMHMCVESIWITHETSTPKEDKPPNKGQT